MTFLNPQVSSITTGRHWSEPAGTVRQPAQCLNELIQEIRVRFLGKGSQTRSSYWEPIQEDKRDEKRSTRYGRSSYRHHSSLLFISSSLYDAGKYAVLSQVANVDSQSLTTPVLTGYCWKAVETSAQQVGVPSTKKRTFVTCVRNHPSVEERHMRWKARRTDMRVQPITLGEFIGSEGLCFLSMKLGD